MNDWQALYEELSATLEKTRGQLEKERGEWLALSDRQNELINRLRSR
jgi:hypothetical protein